MKYVEGGGGGRAEDRERKKRKIRSSKCKVHRDSLKSHTQCSNTFKHK